jgi:hypothetical protein
VSTTAKAPTSDVPPTARPARRPSVAVRACFGARIPAEQLPASDVVVHIVVWAVATLLVTSADQQVIVTSLLTSVESPPPGPSSMRRR